MDNWIYSGLDRNWQYTTKNFRLGTKLISNL